MRFPTTKYFNMCKKEFKDLLKSFYWCTQESPCLDFCFSHLLEISKTIIYQHCHGKHLRTITHHIRKSQAYVQYLVQLFLFVQKLLMCFYFLRLLLSGNLLDCVCDNLWIKLRLQEETDSQELQCIDDRGKIKTFASLTPPDCGNVKPCYNK